VEREGGGERVVDSVAERESGGRDTGIDISKK
jgi:hypothetical protein